MNCKQAQRQIENILAATVCDEANTVDDLMDFLSDIGTEAAVRRNALEEENPGCDIEE